MWLRLLSQIAIHILPNISRSKGNQAIKFGQLIEAFSLKNCTQNGMENLFQHSFEKTKIQHISGSVVKVLYNLLLLYSKFRAIKIY